MSLYTRKKLQQEAQLVREKLDLKAVEIFNELLMRMPIPTSVAPIANPVDKDHGFAFRSKNSALICVSSPDMLTQFKEEKHEIIKQQFPTFEEANRYCARTKGLIELLVRFEWMETEKAIISATPDACVYRNDRASCQVEDLKDSYDNERIVIVSIVYDDGFAAFTFKETLDA